MTDHTSRPILQGKKALVIGIANDSSIAYGCAKAFRELDADLAITYLNEKARPYVEPLAREMNAALFLPLDVSVPGTLEKVFEAVADKWGRLDILVHSIAFAPKEDLQGGLLDCSAEGFTFNRMIKIAMLPCDTRIEAAQKIGRNEKRPPMFILPYVHPFMFARKVQ